MPGCPARLLPSASATPAAGHPGRCRWPPAPRCCCVPAPAPAPSRHRPGCWRRGCPPAAAGCLPFWRPGRLPGCSPVPFRPWRQPAGPGCPPASRHRPAGWRDHAVPACSPQRVPCCSGWPHAGAQTPIRLRCAARPRGCPPAAPAQPAVSRLLPPPRCWHRPCRRRCAPSGCGCRPASAAHPPKGPAPVPPRSWQRRGCCAGSRPASRLPAWRCRQWPQYPRLRCPRAACCRPAPWRCPATGC